MKAAPEGVAMFVRPDWKDIKAYEERCTRDFHGGIAWEFIRRNPDYQTDVDLYCAEVQLFANENLERFEEYGGVGVYAMGSFHMEEQPERWRYWCQLVERKWGLALPFLTNDEFSGNEVPFPPLDDPESFERETWQGIKGPRVLVPVDLSEPLEVMLKKAEYQIRRMRDAGIKSGAVKPTTNRVLSTAVYIEYLRILDGIAAGETIQKIGEVLSPSAANTPEEKQRDKRIRAAYKAALKMQDGGYRVLMY